MLPILYGTITNGSLSKYCIVNVLDATTEESPHTKDKHTYVHSGALINKHPIRTSLKALNKHQLQP